MNDKQKAVIFEFMNVVLQFMAARLHPAEQLTLLEDMRKVKLDAKAEWSTLDIFKGPKCDL